MSVEDVVEGFGAIEDAHGAYLEAEDFWRGTVDEFFSSDRIKQLVSKTGQPYKFNFAEVPIKSLLGRVELRSIGVPDDEAATTRLQEIYDANDMDVQYPDIFETAFVYGDAYTLALPYVGNLPGAGDDELAIVGVESILVNPKECRLIYDDLNDRRKRFFIRRWCIDEETSKVWYVDLHYADRYEYWETRVGGDPSKPQSWMARRADDPNDAGEVTAYHYRTASPYGIPVHRNAYGPQLAINKMLITQLTTSDAAGWPQRFGLTDEGAVLDHATDGPDWAADETATVTADQATGRPRGGVGSSVRGGPGTMQIWNGMKEVGQFDPADSMQYFMDPATRYINMMAILTDTPLHDFEKTILPPSGESRKVAERPLTKKAERMQRRFRSTVSEQWRAMMRLARIPVSKIDVRWKPAYVAEGVQDWQAIALQQAAGVPTDQTLVEAGYDDRQVKAWLDSSTEAMSLSQRVDLVVKIADAAQKLSATVSASGGMNVVSADAIISMMLGQATEQNVNPA